MLSFARGRMLGDFKCKHFFSRYDTPIIGKTYVNLIKWPGHCQRDVLGNSKHSGLFTFADKDERLIQHARVQCELAENL